MLTPLAALLGATGLLAGVTGAWSPCGFSMVDTLASAGGRRGKLVSCATFACGALLGGVATFAALSLVGAALRGVGAGAPVAVAAAIAAAAALGEARGVRIVPQVRRQVPEPWRRVLPLPLAAWLYGILLGLGFTTFVLTLAVWALAGICVALGDPELGIVIGLGFGLGRAVPVVALAPVARRPIGVRAVALMAERPLVLRGLRLADAAGLAACAAVIAAAPAEAEAAVVVASGSDPSAAGNDLAWQAPDGTGLLQQGGRVITLSGEDPAIGGRMIAWHRGSLVIVARRDDLVPVMTVGVRGVDELAVSDRWLVYRARGELWGRRLASPRRALHITRPRRGGQVGRPVLNGDTVVYSVTGSGGSAISAVDLRRRRGRVIRRSGSSQFLNPSLLAGRLLYVGESDCSQLLRLGRPDSRRERFLVSLAPIARHDAGHERGHTPQGSETDICPGGTRRAARSVLWTTALARRYAYVTVLRFGATGLTSPRILRVRR